MDFRTKKRPKTHKIVKYFPGLLLRTIHLVAKYTLKYLLLVITLIAECRRVYAFSTKRFNGGLGYDYEQDMGNLSRLPRHMSFVINEDVSTDYCDVANLIVWTIAMGIPYISLYDRHGILNFEFYILYYIYYCCLFTVKLSNIQYIYITYPSHF